MEATDSQAYRGVTRVGKWALLCWGLVAMLALVVVVAVLTPVMLAAALPATMMQQRGGPRGRRFGGSTSNLSASHKAVASQGQPGQ